MEKAKFVFILVFHNFTNFFSCRHAYIGRYFDENVVNCSNNCDFCKNPQKVKEGLKCLEKFERVNTNRRGMNNNEEEDGQLYGGGRKR